MCREQESVPRGTLSNTWRAIAWRSGGRDHPPEQSAGRDNKSYPAHRATEDELAARREKATEMQEQGATTREIAKELGVSAGTAAGLASPAEDPDSYQPESPNSGTEGPGWTCVTFKYRYERMEGYHREQKERENNRLWAT